MHLLSLSIILSIFFIVTQQANQTIVCPGNRFKYNSQYSIGRKTDIQLTFDDLNAKKFTIRKLEYKQDLFRTYRIQTNNNMTAEIDLMQQDWRIEGANTVRFIGATARITYSFVWFKKQLETESHGTGSGQVTTDAINFAKSLVINRNTNNLQWKFKDAPNITISNSLTLKTFQPYKQADYNVVNQMLNHLKNNGTTLKTLIIQALNANYVATLKTIVQSYKDTHPQQQQIHYTYSDYHGQIDYKYNNTMLDLRLIDKKAGGGIYFLESQSIDEYDNFDCGPNKVPFQPEDPSVFGGFQQFLSNSFFRSNLRYALQQKKFLNIKLSNQNWQSHAFQFFMGDLHDVMPSTKNISSLDPLDGFCEAKYDQKFFTFEKSSPSSYEVKINYTCNIFYNNAQILGIDMLVGYDIEVQAKSDHIQFLINEITGTPIFHQMKGYQIKNYDLANFMVSETMMEASGSPVIGTGYPIKPRITSKLVVRNQYLVLYDKSVMMMDQ